MTLKKNLYQHLLLFTIKTNSPQLFNILMYSIKRYTGDILISLKDCSTCMSHDRVQKTDTDRYIVYSLHLVCLYL